MLTDIINNSLQNGKFPDKMQIAAVQSLEKSKLAFRRQKLPANL